MKKSFIAFMLVFIFIFAQTAPFTTKAATASVPSLQPLVGTNLSTMDNGLKGSYFTGELQVFTQYRIDKNINFNWGTTTRPVSSLKHDHFSIRWTGYVVPTFNEIYTFTVKSDDGVRLYLNDTLLINDWTVHGEKEVSASVQLTAGQPYSIKLEYFQYTGPASVKLYWSSNNQKKELIPENHLYTPKVETVKKGTGTGLIGNYYSGKNFDKLNRTRVDNTINFNWSNHDIKNSGPFSVRWSGRVQPLYTDLYTFKTMSDDGVRLWVNNQLIIDNWRDMAATESKGAIQLQAGQLYDIKLEYYDEGTWPAMMKLYWYSAYQPQEIISHHQLYKPEAPKPGTGTGLKAEYFVDKMLTTLKATQIDPDINFDWGNRGLPVDGVTHNNFSARWTGKIQPQYTENYTIKTISDDGVRLWLNGKLVIDDWKTHGTKSNSYKIGLQAGVMYEVKLEYYQETGFARCEMYWSSDSQKYGIIPQTQLYIN